MIAIAIDVGDAQRTKLYEEAIARLPGVELCGSAQAQALITDHPDKRRALPCLFDRPESWGDASALRGLTAARIMPAHQTRFLPEIAPMKQAAAAGKLGELGLLRVHHWLPGNSGRPAQAAFAHVDLANWFFGEKPEIVHTIEKENYLQLHLGFRGDRMALIDVATSRPGPDAYFSVHLIGSDGTIYADDHRNAQLLFGSLGTSALIHHQNQILATQNMLAEFIAGITEDRQWGVTAEDTANALEVLEETHRA